MSSILDTPPPPRGIRTGIHLLQSPTRRSIAQTPSESDAVSPSSIRRRTPRHDRDDGNRGEIQPSPDEPAQAEASRHVAGAAQHVTVGADSMELDLGDLLNAVLQLGLIAIYVWEMAIDLYLIYVFQSPQWLQLADELTTRAPHSGSAALKRELMFLYWHMAVGMFTGISLLIIGARRLYHVCIKDTIHVPIPTTSAGDSATGDLTLAVQEARKRVQYLHTKREKSYTLEHMLVLSLVVSEWPKLGVFFSLLNRLFGLQAFCNMRSDVNVADNFLQEVFATDPTNALVDGFRRFEPERMIRQGPVYGGTGMCIDNSLADRLSGSLFMAALNCIVTMLRFWLKESRAAEQFIAAAGVAMFGTFAILFRPLTSAAVFGQVQHYFTVEGDMRANRYINMSISNYFFGCFTSAVVLVVFARLDLHVHARNWIMYITCGSIDGINPQMAAAQQQQAALMEEIKRLKAAKAKLEAERGAGSVQRVDSTGRLVEETLLGQRRSNLAAARGRSYVGASTVKNGKPLSYWAEYLSKYSPRVAQRRPARGEAGAARELALGSPFQDTQGGRDQPEDGAQTGENGQQAQDGQVLERQGSDAQEQGLGLGAGVQQDGKDSAQDGHMGARVAGGGWHNERPQESPGTASTRSSPGSVHSGVARLLQSGRQGAADGELEALSAPLEQVMEVVELEGPHEVYYPRQARPAGEPTPPSAPSTSSQPPDLLPLPPSGPRPPTAGRLSRQPSTNPSPAGSRPATAASSQPTPPAPPQPPRPPQPPPLPSLAVPPIEDVVFSPSRFGRTTSAHSPGAAGHDMPGAVVTPGRSFPAHVMLHVAGFVSGMAGSTGQRKSGLSKVMYATGRPADGLGASSSSSSSSTIHMGAAVPPPPIKTYTREEVLEEMSPSGAGGSTPATHVTRFVPDQDTPVRFILDSGGSPGGGPHPSAGASVSSKWGSAYGSPGPTGDTPTSAHPSAAQPGSPWGRMTARAKALLVGGDTSPVAVTDAGAHRVERGASSMPVLSHGRKPKSSRAGLEMLEEDALAALPSSPDTPNHVGIYLGGEPPLNPELNRNGSGVISKAGVGALVFGTSGSAPGTPTQAQEDGGGGSRTAGGQQGGGRGWRRWIPYNALKARKEAESKLTAGMASGPVTPEATPAPPTFPEPSYLGHKNRLNELIRNTLGRMGRPNDSPAPTDDLYEYWDSEEVSYRERAADHTRLCCAKFMLLLLLFWVTVAMAVAAGVVGAVSEGLGIANSWYYCDVGAAVAHLIFIALMCCVAFMSDCLSDPRTKNINAVAPAPKGKA